MDWIEVLGYIGAVAIILTLFFIVPLIGAVLISTFIASATGLSGLSWWCVVITIYFIITSILYRQSK